jgi:hypothetical protein
MVFSCQRQEQENALNGKLLPIPVQLLSGEVVSKIEDYKQPGVLLNVVDTFLVIWRQNDPMFQVYGTNSHELLAEFGYRGSNPSEFVSPFPVKYHKIRDSDKPLYLIADAQSRRVATVDLLALTSGDPSYISFRGLPPPSLVKEPIWIFYAQENELLLQESLDKDQKMTRFSFIDEMKEIKYQASDLLDYPLQGPHEAARLKLSSQIAYHPKLKRVALLPRYFGRIDYYNVNGDFINSYIFQPTPSATNDISKPQPVSNRTFFLQVDATDSFIIGISFEQTFGNKDGANDSPVLFRVFDWEGHPKAIWQIAGDSGNTFAYDEKNHRLYVYRNNAPKDNLWIYPLPPFPSLG